MLAVFYQTLFDLVHCVKDVFRSQVSCGYVVVACRGGRGGRRVQLARAVKSPGCCPQMAGHLLQQSPVHLGLIGIWAGCFYKLLQLLVESLCLLYKAGGCRHFFWLVVTLILLYNPYLFLFMKLLNNIKLHKLNIQHVQVKQHQLPCFLEARHCDQTDYPVTWVIFVGCCAVVSLVFGALVVAALV